LHSQQLISLGDSSPARNPTCGPSGHPDEDEELEGNLLHMATTVDIKKLLESGAHFGHKTSRWHPKMAQYIHSKRGGSHIIDLLRRLKVWKKPWLF
jgi:hypothetical protein